MAYSTQKVEDIREAAQSLADMADELIGYREDEDADRDDKAQANDDFEAALGELVAMIPSAMLPSISTLKKLSPKR